MQLLVLLLALTSTTLVLRSGDRITAEGPVREENGVVTFRMNGLLYSIPAYEIASREAEPEAPIPADDTRRLAVSAEERDRLLRELEKNHEGKEPPSSQVLPPADPPPSRSEVAAVKREEWEWRRMARDYDERVLRAQEEVDMLEHRIERLRSEIRGFVSLGYKPHQFTYQTSSLMLATESLPIARLEVARAERARDQFREDARRQGVLPGWLR